MRNSFFLVSPKQRSDPQRLKEFEDKFIQQWLTQLPVANPALSARLLYDLILEINGLAMPAATRLDNLELLQPSYAMTEDYLRSMVTKGGLPKDNTEHKAFKLLTGLQKHFTIGYWLVAKELTGSPIGWFKSKQSALSVQRCIKGLGSILISHYLMALPHPDWIWLDLHSLYKLSVKAKLNTVHVADTMMPAAGASSAQECYSAIVLLCLANPYGLMAKEIEQVYAFAQSLSGLVRFHDQPVADQTVQCTIVADEDKPPCFQFQPPASAFKAAPMSLYLDFYAIHQALSQRKPIKSQAQARFANTGGGANAMAPDLFNYLKKRWSGMLLADMEPFTDRLDRYVAIGLANSYKLLLAKDTEQDGLEHLAHSVANHLLASHFGSPNMISVGSLVSIRKTDAPKNQRALGVISQAFTTREQNDVSFSVQRLAGQCIAAVYRCKNTTNSERSGVGLLYKQANRTYVVIDNFIFKDGDALTLVVNHKELNVELSNRTNIALGYWQFECTKPTDAQH